MAADRQACFERAVYVVVSRVPEGRVTGYGEIAKALGISPRRVAAALKRNPDPLSVPCHRVVMSNGSLGGYSYGGVEAKKRLLELEGVEVRGGRVPRRYFVPAEELLGLLGEETKLKITACNDSTGLGGGDSSGR